MMLVDDVLSEEEGSQHPVTREQLRAAFLHLTDPTDRQGDLDRRHPHRNRRHSG
jgi:hypothetical protein